MRVDVAQVRELGVGEPPGDLEAGEVRHAARAEAGDDLRRHRLALDALASDGGLDEGSSLSSSLSYGDLCKDLAYPMKEICQNYTLIDTCSYDYL